MYILFQATQDKAHEQLPQSDYVWVIEVNTHSNPEMVSEIAF